MSTRTTTPEEKRMTEALAQAWRRGYRAGWDDGVSDATEDEPGDRARNPYTYDERGAGEPCEHSGTRVHSPNSKGVCVYCKQSGLTP